MSKKLHLAGGFKVSKVKTPGKPMAWTVRTPDGKISKIKEQPRSAEAMDKIVKRYAGTMKRLADR